MRCLGIDYGKKRIGLSCGDELGVATPLPALIDPSPKIRQEQLAALIRRRRITDLVLGHPLNMDDTVGFKAREAEAFAAQLQKNFGLPVHLVDERLTSYEAEQTIPKQKRRAVRATGLIDSRAACLILQDFLNQRFPPAPVEESPRISTDEKDTG
jgi:putative Holliday junction resolvase